MDAMLIIIRETMPAPPELNGFVKRMKTKGPDRYGLLYVPAAILHPARIK